MTGDSHRDAFMAVLAWLDSCWLFFLVSADPVFNVHDQRLPCDPLDAHLLTSVYNGRESLDHIRCVLVANILFRLSFGKLAATWYW